MGLQRIEQELAAILMEPSARKQFAADPRGFLRRRGVKGGDLDLLASLAPDDLAYFAERRNIDRHHALRADAPRSVRLLESAHGRLTAYFRAFPYSLEDPRAETARFARWCRAAGREGSVPAVLADVAAFEAAGLRMMATAARPTRASAKPRRAHGVRLLHLGHAISGVLRTGDAGAAKLGPTTMALLRTADDVRWFTISPLEEALLRMADGRRTRASWLKAAGAASRKRADAAVRSASALARNGLLAPPPARRHG